MSGVLRTLRERVSRQPASRLRRVAARAASSVPGFLRLLPARAAPLAALAVALGLFAFPPNAAGQASEIGSAKSIQRGTVFTLIFNQGALASSSIPPASHFTVGGVNPSNVAPSGNFLFLGMTTAPSASSVTVAYTAGTPQLAYANGTAIGSFSVTAENDIVAPTVASVETNTGGSKITMTFDEVMANGYSEQLSSITIKADGVELGLGSWITNTGDLPESGEWNAITITLVSGTTIEHGQTVTIGYTQPTATTNRLQDDSNNYLVSFADKAVTNNVPDTNVPPSAAPTGLTVSAGTNSGELDASWTAPSGTITDYDLRYYEGSADPTDTADWVEEHETNGLGTGDSTSTSATIKGLKASTAYRVQVRAGNAAGESAWSASVAATTGAAPSTNRAPRAVTRSGQSANICKLWTDTTQPSDTLAVTAGSLASIVLKTRGTETGEWPNSCTTGSRDAPVFDDRDGGDLYYTLSYTLPDNVRGFGGEAPFYFLGGDRVFAQAVAIGSARSVRIDLTARDEHGASATAWVRFDVGVMPNAAGAPQFSATVPDQTIATGTAFSLVLPAATGGDVRTSLGSAVNSPYTYAVSGLPPGLSFDAATRTISGTPTGSGTYTVTYTADDADGNYSLKATPSGADRADAASQTFTMETDRTAPVLLSARVNGAGTHVILTYDEELNTGFIPKYHRYKLILDGTQYLIPRNIISGGNRVVPVSGSTVTLQLGNPGIANGQVVSAGQAVALNYNAGNPDDTYTGKAVRDQEGNTASGLSAFPVTNPMGDATAPALSLAEVNGSTLTLYYNENLDPGSIPATTDFSVSVAGTARTPTNVAVSDGSVMLTLVPGVGLREDAVTVTYTVPGTNPIADLAGNKAPALTGHAVTNNTHELGLRVRTGNGSGSLSVSWTAPSGTITDYDLRYYEGSTDPTDAADWVEEHETTGLGTADGQGGTADSTATSATITGLKAGTAYRVSAIRSADSRTDSRVSWDGCA